MANGGRIQYAIEFSVDSQGVLKNLGRTLTDIQVKAQSSGVKMKQEYLGAAEVAKQLSHILDQSYNKDLGTINIIRFNEALQKSNLSLRQVQSSLAKVPEGARAYNLLASQILKTNIQLKQSNKMLDEMAITMGNTVRWGVTSSIFNTITSSISKAYSYSKQLNNSLTDIRIVTGKTADEMDRFAESANKAAKNLATSTTNYTNASLIYYQQGLSDVEVKARTETTLKAANVTGQSASEVSEQLTAVWNGYKVNAQEAELYVDKLAAVAATTAADLEELSTGMSKVASAASIMGVDIDQLNAQLATVVSVTRQAPESVGTAFKTIYARMGDIEAGLDTETSLGEYTKKMNEMGFNVLDTNGKLKDMGFVIEEIGNKWTSLSREQQVALSQIMAGTRQYNNLLALFDNWDMYTDALHTSANAVGTLQNQQDIYFESTEAHLDVLQATWEDVYSGLVDTDELNTGLDLITQLAQTVDNFFDSFGGGIKSITAFGAIVANVFNKQISSAIIKANKNQDIFQQNVAALQAKEQFIAQGAASVSPNAKTEDQALYAQVQKELDYAERIKAAKNGISTEDYNQLTILQQRAGQLEYEASFIEVEVKKKAESLGLDFQKLQTEDNYLLDLQKEQDISKQTVSATSQQVQNNIANRQSQAKIAEELTKIQKTLKNNSHISKEDQKTLSDQLSLLETSKLSHKDILKSKNEILKVLQKINQQEQANIDKIDEQIEEGTILQEDLSQAEDIRTQQGMVDAEANQSLEQAEKSKNIAKDVTMLTTALSSMAMAWSSVNMMFQTWTDESASFGDKMLQTFMTLGMVVPSVISSYNTLSQALGKTVSLSQLLNANKEKQIALENIGITTKKKEIQELAINTMMQSNVVALQNQENLSDEQQILLQNLQIASDKKRIAILGAMSTEQLISIGYTEAQAIALQKAKAAQDAHNASMLASPWTWIALAITAVIAGIAIYTNSVREANKAQIKEHQTAIDELKAKRQEVEENKKLVKSYQELKNAFDQGKYTKQEMYDKTLELCGAYANEINMLDLLEGRYDNVSEAIKKARLAEIEDLSKDSKEAMQHYQDMLIPYQTETAQIGTKGYDFLDSLFDFTTFRGSSKAINNINGGFSNINEGQKILTLNAGYSGQDEAEVLSWLEHSSAFQGINHKITGLFQTGYEIGIAKDISTPEEFAATYREIEQIYRDMSDSLDESVKQESETYHALYEWLEKNKEYVEGVEEEQRVQTNLKAEKALYELNFDEEEMTFADYQKKRDELYFETLYSKEISKEEAEKSGDYREKDGKYYAMYDGATRADVDKIVDQKLKEGTVSGEQWIAQEQLYNNLVERFGQDQSELISTIMSDMDSADFQALLTLDIDEIDSLEKLSIYIERAQALANRNKIQIGLEITQKSLDALLEGKELTKEQIDELEAQFPELAAIWDKNSRAYLETLQQIREEQEKTLSDTYIQEKAFNWEQLNNAIEDYEENFEDLENGEFSTPHINSAGDYAQYQKDRENYIKLDQIEDLRKLKEGFESFFASEYQFQISITDDILTDIDNIVSKTESLQKAVSMIGDGFKLSAKDSKELFEIFPELAQDAEILADGTLQLNQQVVNDVLKGYGLEIDADKEKTILTIQNRIAELEMHRSELQQKLEYIKGTAATEINYNEIIGENQEQWADYESKLSEDTSENQVKNSAASATAMIEHWAAVEQAAIDYAKTAADAASGKVTGPRISTDNYKIKTEIETSTEVTGTEEAAQSVEAEAEKRKQELINFIQNLIDSDTEQIADLTSGLGMMLSDISEIGSVDSKTIDLLEDEIDRYHDINILLDDMAKKIERVNRAQEHLVGADWLAAQEQGLKLLEEEIKLRRQKQEIQQAEAVELQGHLLADGVKFFDDGSVANYAEIMIAQLAKANQARMSGNEDVADAAEKNYEAFKENFERYEELRDEIEDLADEITDMMYEQISKKVEAFTAKLTVELDTTQAQKEWKEFTNQLFISANNALAQITAQSEIYSANRNIATQTTGKYEQIVNEGIKAQSLVEGTAEEGTTSVYAQWSEELQQYIFDQAKWQEDMQASQQEAQEAILQILDDVDALGETAIGLLEDTIAAQKEQLAIYDDMNSLLNHSLKLQELFTGEKDYDAKGRIYAEQATISDQKARDAAARRNYALSNINTYAQAYNEAKQKYDEAVANGTGDVTVLEKQLEITKQAYEDMKNELKESTDDFYSSIEEQIEAAKNVYVNTINKAMADMEKMFTGGKGLSYINEEWDLINKNAERYLDTVNSTYEVQALESKYIKAMDSTSNLSAQKKINKAMEEELKALREKDKLSQYDIDRANKKYELTMKQIALEEAQANKSTMRLRRDAQGNYSYQFVADEDEVSDAQQDLLAAQNDLYNFDKERYQQTLDDILSIYQEYQQKMLEAAQINDPIARAEKEKLITEQYQQLMLAIAADNETAKQNLGMSTTEALQGQYDINRSNFEAITQGIFDNFSSVEEGMSTNFETIMSNMITGWSGGVQSMIDKIAGDGPDGFKQQSQNAFEIAQQAAKEFDDKLTAIGDNFSGEGNTADRILSDVQEINDKLDSFKKDVLDPTIAAAQAMLPDVWSEYKSGVDLAVESMNTLATQLSAAYKSADELSTKLTKVASQSPINVKVNYQTTGDATTQSGRNTPGGDSTPGPGTTTTPTPEKTGLLEVGNELTWMGTDKDEGGYPRKSVHSTDQAEGAELPRDKRWKIITVWARTESWGDPWYNIQSGNIKASIPDYAIDKSTMSFDTGGYTGEWGGEGRMAMLHEKEIVLNQTDTANILDAVSIARGIGDMLASLQSNWLSNLSSVQVPTISNSETNNSTAQTVNITAEFPNASSATEIEKALKNLVNIASQRAQAFK